MLIAPIQNICWGYNMSQSKYTAFIIFVIAVHSGNDIKSVTSMFPLSVSLFLWFYNPLWTLTSLNNWFTSIPIPCSSWPVSDVQPSKVPLRPIMGFPLLLLLLPTYLFFDGPRITLNNFQLLSFQYLIILLVSFTWSRKFLRFVKR